MSDPSTGNGICAATCRRTQALWILALLCLVAPALTAFELDHARSFQLENGLELIVLEEPALPLVSVQMLYRVGARNEEVGRTGLTHFLEYQIRLPVRFNHLDHWCPGINGLLQISRPTDA